MFGSLTLASFQLAKHDLALHAFSEYDLIRVVNFCIYSYYSLISRFINYKKKGKKFPSHTQMSELQLSQ